MEIRKIQAVVSSFGGDSVILLVDDTLMYTNLKYHVLQIVAERWAEWVGCVGRWRPVEKQSLTLSLPSSKSTFFLYAR